jgi:tryptophanyl-tRNA synthetase
MKRVLSGMKPTGGLTLGNYIGALKPWVDTQYDGENFYMIADLHAISVPQDPTQLRATTYELAAAYIASGLDTDRNSFFIQSHIPAHSELSWLLTCQAKMGWLNRMTQFKDVAGKDSTSIGVGLFTYPALMAADILIYDTTHVPVGDDQKQHVELTRDIALSFNQQFGPVFVVPEPVIKKEGARIKSLRDGLKKMSKSDLSDASRINLEDSAELIADKIKRAKTDTGVMPDAVSGFDGRPEVQNLVEIMAILSDQSVEKILSAYAGAGFAPFKKDLADLVVSRIVPIGDKMKSLLQDQAYLRSILQKGCDQATPIANATVLRAKQAMGFVPGFVPGFVV